MNPLTILHLAANRWWTGSADPIIQLVSGLRARGHRVLLAIIPGDRFAAKARRQGSIWSRASGWTRASGRARSRATCCDCARSFAKKAWT